MKNIQFDYIDSCSVSAEKLTATINKLHAEITRVSQAQSNGYNTDYASINLPNDPQLLTNVNQVVKEKKVLNPTVLIVIGIGGSNLGTVALIEALQGKFYNQTNDIELYFADTVDSDYLKHMLDRMEKELCSGNNILLNVISKSGTTTETIANFQLFFEVLKKHRPYNYHNFIIITTDENSALWNFAQKEEIIALAIPEKVGGRYSVFSAVGLFPLAFCGIDIASLQKGAQSSLRQCISINNNAAAISASILYLLNKQGYAIHDTFLFSVELEGLGKWYRQLMAESIGKSHDRTEKKINNGIIPTVSIGSTDLHSIAQLYLSGPYNIFTTFVSIEKNNTNVLITDNPLFHTLAPTIQNKSFATVMNAILKGVIAAYRNDNRPFVHMVLPEKNAYYLGQWMQIKMLEIIYLGFLMNINPFDQPNVELYKQETKKILSQP
jgi:glucose-6-phosphate isomerase